MQCKLLPAHLSICLLTSLCLVEVLVFFLFLTLEFLENLPLDKLPPVDQIGLHDATNFHDERLLCNCLRKSLDDDGTTTPLVKAASLLEYPHLQHGHADAYSLLDHKLLRRRNQLCLRVEAQQNRIVRGLIAGWIWHGTDPLTLWKDLTLAEFDELISIQQINQAAERHAPRHVVYDEAWLQRPLLGLETTARTGLAVVVAGKTQIF